MRCLSPFCITNKDGVKGREFEPREDAKGVEETWCPSCVALTRQVQFFATQTAAMIRSKYQEYNDTNLPTNVKLILTQFARELITELGQGEL